MSNHQKILLIAQQTREWAEKKAKKEYFTYGSCLCGLCAIASAHLFKALKKQGFDPQIHMAEHLFGDGSHVFITADGFLIDVTATQFEIKKKVVVRPYKSSRKWFWKKQKTFNSISELAKHQYEEGWESSQRVKVK